MICCGAVVSLVLLVLLPLLLLLDMLMHVLLIHLLVVLVMRVAPSSSSLSGVPSRVVGLFSIVVKGRLRQVDPQVLKVVVPAEVGSSRTGVQRCVGRGPV